MKTTAAVPFKVVDGPTGLITHHHADGTITLDVQRPSRTLPGMSHAAHDEEVTVHHLSDVALADRVLRLRRSIEDDKRQGADAAGDERDLRVTVALQRVRLRLRWRYGARDAYGAVDDRGTDVYDRWLRLDEPPSYALAFSIDRDRFDQGRSHVVQWATRPGGCQ